MVESYRDLIVWRRGIEMTLSIYRLTTDFPESELFGLVSQLRRASVSVSSNIAEGYGRNSTGEFKQFLGAARGSNLEVQTQLVLRGALSFGRPEAISEAEALSNEVSKMLNAMTGKL